MAGRNATDMTPTSRLTCASGAWRSKTEYTQTMPPTDDAGDRDDRDDSSPDGASRHPKLTANRSGFVGCQQIDVTSSGVWEHATWTSQRGNSEPCVGLWSSTGSL